MRPGYAGSWMMYCSVDESYKKVLGIIQKNDALTGFEWQYMPEVLPPVLCAVSSLTVQLA